MNNYLEDLYFNKILMIYKVIKICTEPTYFLKIMFLLPSLDHKRIIRFWMIKNTLYRCMQALLITKLTNNNLDVQKHGSLKIKKKLKK